MITLYVAFRGEGFIHLCLCVLLMWTNCLLADSGVTCPITVPILTSFLIPHLPAFVTVSDSSLETIALLRVLHALNRHWATMYDVSFFGL